MHPFSSSAGLDRSHFVSDNTTMRDHLIMAAHSVVAMVAIIVKDTDLDTVYLSSPATKAAQITKPSLL